MSTTLTSEIEISNEVLDLLKSYPTSSSFQWLQRVLIDFAIVALAMIACRYLWDLETLLKWPAMLICLLVIGARQHALALLGHEGAHGAAHSSSKINDFLTTRCCFWFFGIALKPYRRFHFEHHRKVGTEEDPELQHKLHRSPFLRNWKLPFGYLKTFVFSALDLLGAGLPHSAYAIGVLMGPDNVKDFVIPKSYMLFWVVLFCVIGLFWVPLLWFLCLSTTFWLAFRLRVWTEHVVEEDADEPTQRVSAKPWQKFFFVPHNTWCHWEHHYTWDELHIPLPCWHLPRARKILSGSEYPEIISIEALAVRLAKAHPSLGVKSKVASFFQI